MSHHCWIAITFSWFFLLAGPASAQQAPEPPKPAPPGGVAGATASVDAPQTTVIKLRFQPSTDVLNMLRQLLRDDESFLVNMADDPRTNSIILRGSSEKIEEIRALMQQLDTEAAAPPTPALATAPAAPPATAAAPAKPAPPRTARLAYGGTQLADTVWPQSQPQYYRANVLMPTPAESKAMQEFAALEEKAAQAARDYRAASAVAKPGDTTVTQLRERLAETVQQAFDKRQQLQELEVKQLKERLAKIEETLAKRTQHRQDIIHKRVQELLEEDNDLNWETSAVRPPSAVANANAPTYIPVTEEIVWPDGKKQQVTRYVVAPPQATSAPSGATTRTVVAAPAANAAYAAAPTVPAAVPVSGPLGGYAARRELMDAEQELTQAKSRLQDVQRLHANSAISQTEYDLAIQRSKNAQQRLDLARREFEAQLKLLELETEAAKARVEVSAAKLSEADEVNKRARGSIPQGELDRLRAELRLAELQLQHVQTLLQLHRSAATETPPRAEPKGSTDKLNDDPFGKPPPRAEPKGSTDKLNKDPFG